MSAEKWGSFVPPEAGHVRVAHLCKIPNCGTPDLCSCGDAWPCIYAELHQYRQALEDILNDRGRVLDVAARALAWRRLQ